MSDQVFLRANGKILYKAVKGTNDEWFERVLDIQIKEEFYIKGANFLVMRDSNGQKLRTLTKVYKLARRNKVNNARTEYFEAAAEERKDATLFERVSIPQAIWSRMTPLETKPDVTFLACHSLCDQNEECNMFRWEERTCTILYVSNYIVLSTGLLILGFKFLMLCCLCFP